MAEPEEEEVIPTETGESIETIPPEEENPIYPPEERPSK